MKLFSYDSKFIEFMNTLVDVVVLNFLWLIGCIPIVTVGTSTIAAYSVALKIVENSEGKVFSQFWKAYKENLGHGCILTVIFAAAIYTVWISFQLFEAAEGNPIIFTIIGFVLVFFIVIHGIYIFPLEARYENKLWTALTNARRIGIRFFIKTLIIICLVGLEVWLFYGVNDILFVVGLLIGPMCIMLTISGMVMPIFRSLEKEAESLEGEERGTTLDTDSSDSDEDEDEQDLWDYEEYENEDEIDYESPVVVEAGEESDTE